jgi:hypothetical protein
MFSKGLFLLLAGVTPVLAQAQFISRSADRTRVIGAEWNRPLYQGIKCDAKGRLFFRPYDRSNSNAPVVRVNADGEDAVRFAFAPSAELKGASVYDFALSGDGALYQVAQKGDQVYVVRFSDEGFASAPVLLQKEFFAAHAVPISENRLLIIGSEAVTDGPKRTRRRPFAGIFDASGRLQTEISGVNEKSVSNPPTSNKGGTDSDDEFSPSVLLGSIEAGADGLIYLFLSGDPGRVLVLDGNGKQLRELRVDAPLPQTKATAMHVARGQIALLFVEESDKAVQRSIMVLLDPTTGERLRSYDVSDLGLAFACFTGDSASFLSSSNGKLAIKTASLR